LEDELSLVARLIQGQAVISIFPQHLLCIQYTEVTSEEKNACQLSFSGSISVARSEFFFFGDQYFAFRRVVQPPRVEKQNNASSKSNSKARIKKKHGLKATPTITPWFESSEDRLKPSGFPVSNRVIQCALQFHH